MVICQWVKMISASSTKKANNQQIKLLSFSILSSKFISSPSPQQM
jgi:hypothetical protein